jgi:hypothetical protein
MKILLKDLHRSEFKACPSFTGNGCLDWLSYQPAWRGYMRYLGVETIVVKDTHNGVPLHQYAIENTSRSQQFATFYNQQIRKTEGAKNLKRLQATFREYCPWLAYYLKGMAIPVGTKSTFEGRTVTVGAPDAKIMDQCLDYFANGAEDISYEREDYFPENFILGDKTSVLLTSSSIDDMAEMYNNDFIESRTITATGVQEVVASFHEVSTAEASDALDSHESLSRFIELKFGPEAKAEFDKAVLTEQSLRASIQKDFNEAMQNCNKVFQKLSQECRDMVADHLRDNLFHAAYKTLQVHFIRLGMGDTNVFDKDVRAIKLYPGKDLQTHFLEMSDSQAMGQRPLPRQDYLRWAQIPQSINSVHFVLRDGVRRRSMAPGSRRRRVHHPREYRRPSGQRPAEGF